MTAPKNLRDLLILHEGWSNRVYKDSLGFDTIGVGHLVDARKGGGLPKHVVKMMMHWSDIYSGVAMPDNIVDALLDYDIDVHTRALELALPWAKNLDGVRHAVLCDMCFNLGDEPFDSDGVKDWPIFVNQVRTGQYLAAAANMRKTTWARQVKGRAERLARMMETGKWPV